MLQCADMWLIIDYISHALVAAKGTVNNIHPLYFLSQGEVTMTTGAEI